MDLLNYRNCQSRTNNYLKKWKAEINLSSGTQAESKFKKKTSFPETFHQG